MAEFVFRDMLNKRNLQHKIFVKSSATSTDAIGCNVHHGTRNVLAENNIPFEYRRAVQLTAADGDYYDLFVAMDGQNVFYMKQILKPDHHVKITKLMDYTGESRDVADPWYTGDFDVTYRDIANGSSALIDYLVSHELF